MFKENRDFLIYIVGIVVFFLVIFFVIRIYFTNSGISLGNIPIFNINLGNPTQAPTLQPSPSPAPTAQVSQPPVNIDLTKNYLALVQTNKGDFILDLFEQNAPNTVNNFIYLAITDFYTGTKFHRLVPELLVQGGSPNSKNDDPLDDEFGGPGYLIEDEINWDSLNLTKEQKDQLIDDGYSSDATVQSKQIFKYSVAMANPGPNQNGSQFFIITGDTNDIRVHNMRGRHTVFAQIIEGKDIIDTIANTQVDNPNSANPRPLDSIIIESIVIYTE